MFAGFVGVFVITGWQTSKINPLSERDVIFKRDDMSKAIAWPEQFYGVGWGAVRFDDSFGVYKSKLQLVWGLQETIDKSSSDRWSRDDIGAVRFDDSFDLSPPAA
eukprot:74900_1